MRKFIGKPGDLQLNADGLRGTPLYVTGHSIAYGFNITPSQRWPERLASRYDMDLTNGAVGGSCIVENSFDMNGDTNFRSYGTPRRGMAIVDAVFNSNAVLGNTTAAHNAHKDGMRTVLAHLSCSVRQEAQNWTTKVGTWTTLADSRSSSGTLLYSLTANDYIETTFTGKDAYVVIFGNTVSQSNVSVSLNGTLVSWDGSTTIPTTRGVAFNPQNYAASNTAAPFVVKVSAASTGTHTVRVTNLQSNFCFVDTLLTINPEPQPIFVCLDPTSNPAFSATTAILTTYNTETAAIAAEFPNATVIDLNNLSGLTYMYDNTHLDEAGNQKMADFIEPYLLDKAYNVGAHVGATQDNSSGVQPDSFDRKVYKYMNKPSGFTSTYLNALMASKTITCELVSVTTAAAPAAASAAANVELFSTPKATRRKLDLSKCTQVRITCMPIALGNAATAAIKVSFMATEAATWSGTDAGASVVIGNGTAGVTHDSGWQTLVAGARLDNVSIAALVSVAFGTTAPTVSNITVQFR